MTQLELWQLLPNFPPEAVFVILARPFAAARKHPTAITPAADQEDLATPDRYQLRRFSHDVMLGPMEIGNRLNTKGNCQSSNAFHKREATRPLVPQAYIVGMPWSVEKARFATAAAETCMTCQEL
jgi:hypothetical protein